MAKSKQTRQQAQAAQQETEIQNPLGQDHVFLLPEEIEIDPDLDVRPCSTQHSVVDEEVAALAESIERNGQLDDAIVAPMNGGGAEGKFKLLAGHRRLLAVNMINKRTGIPIRLRCRIDTGLGSELDKAISSNRDRMNPSPMDTALLIKKLRAVHGEDAKGSAQIAKLMGLKSKANVTQHERLLGEEFTDTLREQLHGGVLTMDSAFTIAKSGVTDEKKQQEVVEEARNIQVAEDVKRIEENPKIGQEEKKKQTKAAKEQKRVKAPAVKKALQKVDAGAKVKWDLKGIKEFFGDMAGDYAITAAGVPKYGYPDGAIQEFLACFVARTAGEVTDGVLQKKWDLLVEKADRGTKASLAALREKEEKEVQAVQAVRVVRAVRAASRNKPATVRKVAGKAAGKKASEKIARKPAAKSTAKPVPKKRPAVKSKKKK